MTNRNIETERSWIYIFVAFTLNVASEFGFIFLVIQSFISTNGLFGRVS